MGWVEDRITQDQYSIQILYRRLMDLEAALRAVQQAVRAAGQALPQQGQDGGGGGVFVCWCPASVAGTWDVVNGIPTAPNSFQAELYQVMGNSIEDMGQQTIYNWMPAATVANRACIVVPDAGGGYVVVGQSCT